MIQVIGEQHLSKGSKQRPTDQKKFNENYEKIFNHKVKTKSGEVVRYRFKDEKENNVDTKTTQG